MNKHQNIIGIDPDVDKSGVAYLQVATRKLEVTSLVFPLLLEYLQYAKQKAETSGESLIVVVEASWLISHNWHTHSGDNRRVSAAKGNNVGRNHEVGRKIVEMARHYGLEVVEQMPLKKKLAGERREDYSRRAVILYRFDRKNQSRGKGCSTDSVELCRVADESENIK